MANVLLVTGPVDDLIAFERTAYAVARSELDGWLIYWVLNLGDDAVSPRKEVETILKKYRAQIRWSLDGVDPEWPAFDATVRLAADAILARGALKALVESVLVHPDAVTVLPSRRLAPLSLLGLDIYGSNLIPGRAASEVMAESGAIAINPARGQWDGPRVEADSLVYTQRQLHD